MLERPDYDGLSRTGNSPLIVGMSEDLGFAGVRTRGDVVCDNCYESLSPKESI